jgi:hypothetical protein
MNMARRHIEAPSRRRLRWIGAFATASIVVVAMFLVVRQDAEHALPQPDQQDGYKLEALEQRRSADPPAPQAATSAQKSRLRSAQPARADQAAEAEATIGEFASEPADSAAEAPAEEQMTADRWIERLILLKDEGDAERFEHELAAFRKAYPDHPLPAVLRE